MIRSVLAIAIISATLLGAGCGDGKSKVDTRPLTDEQKAKVKQEDQTNDDEERSGSGVSTRRK